MGPHGADDLRQDFGHLTRRYRVVSLETLFLNLRDQDPMESVCTIGFDDGYRDNIDHALPLLKKYGCPASFYVVTDCIDNNGLRGRIRSTISYATLARTAYGWSR